MSAAWGQGAGGMADTDTDTDTDTGTEGGREAAGGPDTPPGSPFPFVGNALALDFVNTEVLVRKRPHDLLPAPGAVAPWWGAAQARSPDADLVGRDAAPLRCDEEGLRAVKEARAALRLVFGTLAEGRPLSPGELSPLNGLLRRAYHRLDATPRGDVSPAYGTEGTGVERLLVAVALSAFRLIAQGERTRLRRCQNCIGLFYDTSKSATRRWCSEVCMNRAWSARHYARSKRRPGHGRATDGGVDGSTV